MRGNFTKGLLVGGIIGASVSMMMGPEKMKAGHRRRVLKTGRNLFRKSGNIVSDVVDLFR